MEELLKREFKGFFNSVLVQINNKKSGKRKKPLTKLFTKTFDVMIRY